MAAIHEAICKIMEEGAVVSKSSRNQQQGFNYRGIDAVMNIFNPLLARHGVFVIPEVIEQHRESRTNAKGNTLLYSILTVNVHFYAQDGSEVCATVVGEGMDSGDKASNKALSAAYKYALFQTFCIPTEELSDPDADSPGPVVPVCEDCGKEIKATEHRGTLYKVSDIIAMSQKSYGKTICWSCAMKRQERSRQEKIAALEQNYPEVAKVE